MIAEQQPVILQPFAHGNSSVARLSAAGSFATTALAAAVTIVHLSWSVHVPAVPVVFVFSMGLTYLVRIASQGCDHVIKMLIL
jgi:hypothetical protein